MYVSTLYLSCAILPLFDTADTIIGVHSNYTLIRDNENGVVDSGDTLLYTVTITNTRYLAVRSSVVAISGSVLTSRICRH